MSSLCARTAETAKLRCSGGTWTTIGAVRGAAVGLGSARRRMPRRDLLRRANDMVFACMWSLLFCGCSEGGGGGRWLVVAVWRDMGLRLNWVVVGPWETCGNLFLYQIRISDFGKFGLGPGGRFRGEVARWGIPSSAAATGRGGTWHR